MADPVSGAGLIAAERRRQVDVEGWTPEHDTEHTEQRGWRYPSLVRAALTVRTERGVAHGVIASRFHFHTCEGRDGIRRCPDCLTKTLAACQKRSHR